MTLRVSWRTGVSVALLALLLLGVLMSVMPPLLRELTAPGRRAHSLARAELPGGDLALVAVPAAPGREGMVALWWAGHEDDQVIPTRFGHVACRAERSEASFIRLASEILRFGCSLRSG